MDDNQRMPGRSGGDLRPKRPAVGKVKPGTALWREETGERLELTNPVNDKPSDCGAASVQRWLQGSKAARQWWFFTLVTEEPYERIVHVRICGGRGL